MLTCFHLYASVCGQLLNRTVLKQKHGINVRLQIGAKDPATAAQLLMKENDNFGYKAPEQMLAQGKPQVSVWAQIGAEEPAAAAQSLMTQNDNFGYKAPTQMLAQQELWENYFPGYKAIRARYQRTKVLLNARNKRMGRELVKDGEELHSKSMANPYIFCKKSFPPNGYYDQAEFHSCLQALNVPKLDLQNLGDSNIATDLSSSPSGWHQPDGPGSLSPGSDGWSRW